MKSIDRVYAHHHKCKSCNHPMKYHNRLGCNLVHCVCENRENITFNELIRRMTPKLMARNLIRSQNL